MAASPALRLDPDAAPSVEIRDLVVRFGERTVVDHVSFSVRPGELFSLLGPNGAGKSTTLSVLAGLLRPAGGDALILGRSVLDVPREAKRELGVVPQDLALYEDLSARENLRFWGRMAGLQGPRLTRRTEEVLELIGLEGRARDRVGTFSGGMKRRLNIGAALLHEPRVIVMDEPTVGIDPQSRRHILDSVRALNQRGHAVLYTTHYMEEAEELSDRLAILDQGKLIALGTRAELVARIGEKTHVRLTVPAGREAAVAAWSALDDVEGLTTEGEVVSLLAADANAVMPLLFERASEVGARVTTVRIEEPNLEAVFLHLTGRALRD